MARAPLTRAEREAQESEATPEAEAPTPTAGNEDTSGGSSEEEPSQSSQVSSLDDDFMNIDEEEETDVPEHMRSQDEPAQPANEPEPSEAAPEQTPESPQEGEGEGEEESQTPEGEAEPEAPQPEEPEQQQATPEQEPEPEQQPLTAEEVQRQRAEWRAQAERDLAEGQFKMPQELVDEFETSPETAIPKLASKLYLDAVEGTTYAIMSQLPQVVQQLNQSQSIYDQYESEFFEMWPMLDRSNQDHVKAVQTHAANFRQINPQASPEDVMKHAGAAAVIALKLPVGEQPAAPAPQPAPHKPAGGGAPGGSPGTSQRSSNPFEVLDEEVDALEGEL